VNQNFEVRKKKSWKKEEIRGNRKKKEIKIKIKIKILDCRKKWKKNL
jgi:hypothetical protein